MASWTKAEIRSWGKNNRPAPGALLPDLFSDEKMAAWQQSILLSVFQKTEVATRKALLGQVRIEKARVLSEQSARSGGITPLLITLVDGRRDEALSTVQANSTIVLDWNYLPEIARRTYDALVERSPRLTGKYIAGLLTFIDQEPGDLSLITTDTEQIQIVASVDYARRLEIGKDRSGQPWVKEVAPHIVEETAIIAQRKFGKLAKVSFNYVELSNAYQIKTPTGWRRRRGVLETEVHYPAIFIVPV